MWAIVLSSYPIVLSQCRQSYRPTPDRPNTMWAIVLSSYHNVGDRPIVLSQYGRSSYRPTYTTLFPEHDRPIVLSVFQNQNHQSPYRPILFWQIVLFLKTDRPISWKPDRPIVLFTTYIVFAIAPQAQRQSVKIENTWTFGKKQRFFFYIPHVKCCPKKIISTKI